MRRPRSIAVLALAGLGLFGGVSLNSVPAGAQQKVQAVQEQAVQEVVQPADDCTPVPGASTPCPPPPPPGDRCPQVPGASDDYCPPPAEECPQVPGASDHCPDPKCNIQDCPPPAECECDTTTTTIDKKFPGVLFNPTYTG